MAKALEKIGHAWLIELENDCLDDVFTLTMGLRIHKRWNILESDIVRQIQDHGPMYMDV